MKTCSLLSVCVSKQLSIHSWEYLRILILYVNYVENIFQTNFQENSWKCASNVDAKDDISVLLITINASLAELKFIVCRNAFTIQIVIIKSIKPYNFFFISCHLRNFVVQLIFICSSWIIFMNDFSEIFPLLVVN